ncbi:hypothetical protein ACFQ1M_01165 [Sungkyunkwania multivorans]|uniref:Secreted protein n=1 Tax=Sungkyunkwania multivorans TaxID=1173618 RepID=A0ABW3CSV1_9FLAO
MFRQTVVSFLLLFVVAQISAQELNSYKYVIIPQKFDFLSEADQYRLNSLTRFLFKNEGFEVLYDTETLPTELADDQCSGLRANVLKEKGMFTTKLTIVLKDCKNDVIYTSPQGTSREKAYREAYNEALKEAFEGVSSLNYTYDPTSVTVRKTKKVTPQPIDEVKAVVKEATSDKTDSPAAVKNLIDVEDTHKDVLYGQLMTNGYQVVDATPKVVMKLLFSGKKDVFIVEDRNAIVFKQEGVWVLSEYDGNTTSNKVINLKL